MASQRPRLAQLRGDDAGDAADWRLLFFSRLPIPRHRVAHVKSVHRVGKIAHEIPAAQLAVGENLKSKLLLFRKNAQDVPILDLMQALRFG